MEKLIKPKNASEWTAYNWIKSERKGRVNQDQIKRINKVILHYRKK